MTKSIFQLGRGLLVFSALVSVGFGQTSEKKSTEPGLEKAVKWTWRVVPSASAWGLPVQITPLPDAPPGSAVPAQSTHVVKKGDALILIAKKHRITVDQLKTANGLTSNLIHIGDELKIPSAAEIALMPPEIAAPPKPRSGAPVVTAFDPEVLLFQIFLNREQFSPGVIDGQPGMNFSKLMYLYQTARGDAGGIDSFRELARAGVGELLTTYTLRPEDFRFILPPTVRKAEAVRKSKAVGKSGAAGGSEKSNQPVAYEELTTVPMLAYRSPWEFVAERFQCSQKLLHDLNPSLPHPPVAGTKFQVPNTPPFRIEEAIRPPLQPAPDAVNPITAMVVDLSRLEIHRNAELLAVFPLSVARPGLRGRGTWTILDAIPAPRLGTFREERIKPPPPSTFFRGETAAVVPETPVLAEEEFLPAGPRNPVGIFWINLAKAGSTEILPFGLTGTSRPDSMMVEYSLGGFRLTNPDIARAVRLLPVGTPLEWKQSGPPTVAPARGLR